MIVDRERPDAPSRRWPFLIGWSLAVGAIVGGFFVVQAKTPAPPSGSVSELAAPAATASGAPTTMSRHLSVVTRDPHGDRLTVPSPQLYSVADGILSYLNYAGQRIAIGLHDDLITGDAPSN